MIRKGGLIRRRSRRCTRDEKRCAVENAYPPLHRRNYRNYGQAGIKQKAIPLSECAAPQRGNASYFYRVFRMLERPGRISFHPRLIYAGATSSQHADHRKRSAATRRHRKENTEITTRRFVRRRPFAESARRGRSFPPPGRIIRPSKQIMEKRSPPARKLCG